MSKIDPNLIQAFAQNKADTYYEVSVSLVQMGKSGMSTSAHPFVSTETFKAAQVYFADKHIVPQFYMRMAGAFNIAGMTRAEIEDVAQKPWCRLVTLNREHKLA